MKLTLTVLMKFMEASMEKMETRRLIKKSAR